MPEVYAEEDSAFLTRLEPLLRVNDAAAARIKGTMDATSPSNVDTRKFISGFSQGSGSPSPSEGSSPLGVSSPTDSKELKRDLMEDVTQRLAKLSSSVKSVSADGAATNPVIGSTRTKGAAAGGASQNEVLANFFQSLLAKKGKTVAGSPPPSTAKSLSPKE